MTDILKKIVAHKKVEIEALRERANQEQWRERAAAATPAPDFHAALIAPGRIRVIAEIKKASPSAGVLRTDFHPPVLAQSYKRGGADCLSILTDQHFFQGSIDYLRDVAAVVQLPLLRKDFILDPIQLYEAKLAGASAALLIAECLTPAELARLVRVCESLQLAPLVELYDPENLPAVIESGGKIIGINNRDLRTFVTDLSRTLELIERIPNDRVVVSESGIKTSDDITRLANAGVAAILVGETFMRAPDPGAKLDELLKGATSTTE